jgi:hypothetical protein
MADPDMNLVISDEENGSIHTGRSYQTKFGVSPSPKDNKRYLNTQDLLLSGSSKKAYNKYEHDFDLQEEEGSNKNSYRNPHPTDNYPSPTGLKPTPHSSDPSGGE